MPRPLVAVTPAAGFVQGPLLAPEVDIGRWPTASHIGNAILREDARGARLAKERKDSPRRIDAAVAAVMAHDRAAALAGVTRDSIYI
jgi:hypothetical protein